VQLAAQSDSKWNIEKKQRLQEKYLVRFYLPLSYIFIYSQDKKIKKEDRVLLFEKLA